MKLLIVDDDAAHRQYLAEVTSGWKYDVAVAGNGAEALEVMASGNIDVILSDIKMPRMDGFELLQTLKQQGSLPPAILMTAFGSLEKALRTIHDLDGFWFLEKPIELTALELLLRRACRHRNLAVEIEELRRQLSYTGVLGEMVGETPLMQEIFALLRQVAPTSAAVMITGESGTGKELVARALHSHSLRSEGPFSAINCAALPETLIESELFGHEKGAFTGAVERRIGAIEAAHGGTLFLDELGEMPMPMQSKLLRVLEDLRFRRLGGKQEIQADVRVVAATNRDPIKAIKEGTLREDLYYRLNVFQIHLPPLRERKADIPVIVNAMVQTMNRKHGTKITNASEAFLDCLSRMDWPGNVRELRNAVERAVILAREGPLLAQHAALANRGAALAAALAQSAQPAPAEALAPVQATPPEAVAHTPEEPVAMAPSSFRRDDRMLVDVSVGMTIDEAERLLIEATLKHTGNNKTRAASILGISTKTMHVKLRQYRLGDEANEAVAAG